MKKRFLQKSEFYIGNEIYVLSKSNKWQPAKIMAVYYKN